MGPRRYELADVDVAVRELGELAVRDVDPADGARRLPVSRELRRGDPAFELERVAAVRASPVLARGSRGMGPSRGALLGTIVRRVLQAARRPTLVVPGTAQPPEFERVGQRVCVARAISTRRPSAPYDRAVDTAAHSELGGDRGQHGHAPGVRKP